MNILSIHTFFLLLLLINPALGAQENDTQPTSAPQTQPNIILILADDLGWMDVSMNGQTRWETPNIDRLAASGMRFTQAYAGAPMCSPTRGAILSGKNPARTQFTGITPNQSERMLEEGRLYKIPQNFDRFPGFSLGMLPESEFTYAEALREAGYKTGFIGKWHVGGQQDSAEREGFDEIYDFDPRNSQFRFDDDGNFCTDLKGDSALKFLEANRDGPFLLHFATNAVHTRIAATQEYIDYFLEKGLPAEGPWNAEYAAFVKHLDDNVGRILDKLDELGIAENTVVVFVSDNGALGGDIASNEPLRGTKTMLYEGGIRVPTVVRWPGVTEPGSVNDATVSATDLYPTFLEMAGLPKRPEQHVDAASFVPALRGQEAADRVLIWHFPHYSGHNGSPCSAIRSGKWKLIKWWTRYRPDLPEGQTKEPAVELYNLETDMSEKHNLAAEMPEKAQELEARLLQELDTLGARNGGLNPDHDPAQPFVNKQEIHNRYNKAPMEVIRKYILEN